MSVAFLIKDPLCHLDSKPLRRAEQRGRFCFGLIQSIRTFFAWLLVFACVQVLTPHAISIVPTFFEHDGAHEKEPSQTSSTDEWVSLRSGERRSLRRSHWLQKFKKSLKVGYFKFGSPLQISQGAGNIAFLCNIRWQCPAPRIHEVNPTFKALNFHNGIGRPLNS